MFFILFIHLFNKNLSVIVSGDTEVNKINVISDLIELTQHYGGDYQ